MILVNWNTIKSIADTKKINIQWTEINDSYFLILVDSTFIINSTIDITTPPNSDQIEFETDYKPNGNTPVYHPDFYFQVSKSVIPSNSTHVVSGFSPAITSSGADIWDGSGYYIFPSSAVLMDVVSTSTSDTLAGVGARSVVIEGLDTNYDIISEEIELNGTTNVSTVNSYLRINSVLVNSVGSSEVNAGTITLKNSGNTYAQINPSRNTTLSSIYTIPDGYYAYVFQGRSSIYKGEGAIVNFSIRQFGLPFIAQLFSHISDSGDSYRVTAPLRLPGKTDIKMSAVKIDTGSTSITGVYDLILIQGAL